MAEVSWGLGSFVVFRYDNPSKKSKTIFSPPRNIMVLTPNFLGHLHGIKVDGLTPVEQESIQRLLQASFSNPENFLAPFRAQTEIRKKELDLLNKQRNDLIRNGQRVIMTPSQNPMFGLMDKAKNLLGSVIGKISTFGRTQVQAAPAAQVNPMIQQKIAQHDAMIKQKKAELDSFYLTVQQQEQNLKNMKRVPTNPYEFYHGFFKMFISNPRRMKDIYRKFNVSYIKTPRLVKSVGIMPNVK